MANEKTPDRETKDVALSLRLDRQLLKRIKGIVDRHHSLNFIPGFSAGEPPVMSRSQVVRLALNEGLTVMEAKLTKAEQKKRGGR